MQELYTSPGQGGVGGSCTLVKLRVQEWPLCKMAVQICFTLSLCYEIMIPSIRSLTLALIIAFIVND